MAKSTKFITASYIMAFVANSAPRRMSTDKIAEMVQSHPTRVRHITSALVKAGLLESYRGGNGGVILAKNPKKITLRDIYDAIQDQSLLSFGMHNPFSKWSDHCLVHSTFEGLYDSLEEKLLKDLAKVRLSDLYKPWDALTEIE